MNKIAWIFASLVVFGIIVSFAVSLNEVEKPTHKINANLTNTSKETPPEYTIDQLADRYEYVKTHVATENVHPYLRPIHFKIGDMFAASGTLVLNKDGVPQYIVTANHLFSDTSPGSDYYDYAVLTSQGYTDYGHLSDVVLDSLRNSDSNESINDIAICHIGEPGLISRTSKVSVSADRSYFASVNVSKINDKYATSISSGQKYPIIGQAVNSQNVPFFIIPYDGMNGESGTGFWGSDGVLYVFSATIPAGQVRDDLDFDLNLKVVTLLCGANITW